MVNGARPMRSHSPVAAPGSSIVRAASRSSAVRSSSSRSSLESSITTRRPSAAEERDGAVESGDGEGDELAAIGASVACACSPSPSCTGRPAAVSSPTSSVIWNMPAVTGAEYVRVEMDSKPTVVSSRQYAS
ncbi:hypothetical protein ACFPRL_24000 [Pseudoclavibacter helvolus]